MIQIRLLGQFDVRIDGKRVTIPSRAGQSLLAYLVLTAGTPHRREKLAGMFWPDTSDESARKYLRQELWRVRKGLLTGTPIEEDYLIADDFTIVFNRNAEYWLDVKQVERPDIELEPLTTNLSFYQGELLPGFYDEWIIIERERIQSIFDSKMGQFLEMLIAAERWTAVQEQSERWLSMGSTLEPAYRGLMLSFGARGDMAKVSTVYQRCISDLEEKFGLDPSPETRALYDGLLKGAHVTSSKPQPSGTVTFLFTDIEGSTNLLDKLKDGYAAVLDDHHKIMRAAFQKWNGREMDTQGDSFFVTFSRALDAVQCAAEAQRKLASHNWTHNSPLRVRMGLHTGEPLLASTGYVGMDVHRAARIGDAGHGGQILLSQTTRELVIQDLPEGLTIRNLGEHRLKDLGFLTPIHQLTIEGLDSEFPPLRTKFSGTEAPAPGDPPFKGLQYFDEMDSSLFFGRELLTARLVDRLSKTRFLSVVIGASGSGKSSLVRAGLIPALKRGGELIDGVKPPKDSPNWYVHIITPTAHPIETLAVELSHGTESVTTTATLMDDLMQDPRSLSLYLARQYPDQHTLLVLDQFEELFTLCRDEFEREAFIDNLLTAISPAMASGSGNTDKGRVTLILTLRADFYAHLAQYPELRDAVAKQQEYIGPMTTEELRRAIEEPAKRGQWEFEPGLVDLILRDVGDEPGALPLLSHALLETWKRRAGHTLTLKGYADAGGVRGAIAHTAESVYQDLSPEEQIIARNIFIRLTELGEGTEDTRRRVSFDELVSNVEDEDEVRNVLNMLADARLVTLGEGTAEVAHEALIREWPTLREWLNQDREGLQLHRRLTETTREWELLEHDDGVLYRGAQLAQAREWASLHPKALNTGEQAFLDASNAFEQKKIFDREAQQKRELEAAQKLAETERQSATRLRLRNRVITAVGVLAVGLAVAAGIFAQRNGRLAEQNELTAQTAQAAEAQAQENFIRSDSQRLAADAIALLNSNGDPELIALLSLQSLKMQYTPQGDSALTRSTFLNYPKRSFTGHSALISDMVVSKDGKYLFSGSEDGTAILWDLETGEQVFQFRERPYRTHVALSPDGRHALVAAGVFLYVLDAKSGEIIYEKAAGGFSDTSYVTFSEDGQYFFRGTYGSVERWDVQAQKKDDLKFLNSVGQAVTYFNPNDGYAVSVGINLESRNLQAWNLTDSNTPIYSIDTDRDIYTATLSPDHKYLLVGFYDGDVDLRDASSGDLIRAYRGHAGFVYSTVFSADGKRFITSGSNGTRLWSVDSGDELLSLQGRNNAQYALFSADEKSIYVGDEHGLIQQWSSSPESELPVFKANLNNSQGYGYFNSVAISPDNHYLAAGGSKGLLLWNLETNALEHSFPTPRELGSDIYISKHNKYLLSGDSITTNLWDINSGKLKFKVTTTPYFPYNQALSPDGKSFALVHSSIAEVWDIEKEELITKFGSGASDSFYRRINYSHDGKYILTTSNNGQVWLWDIQTQKPIKKFIGSPGAWDAQFSPDGKFVVTAGEDRIAHLWDVETEQQIRLFQGHSNTIYRAVFSSDGKNIATASYDGTARIWDVKTGEEIRRYTGHTAGLTNIVFSPDGRYIATSSDDGTARLWDIDYHTTVDYLCSILQRDLTDAERLEYNITDPSPTCP